MSDFSNKTLVEKELGGFIRAIEFIYKESGVNRPLKPDDDDKINLNRTKYRNQINKVGNAIEEIISGLQTKPAEPGKETIQQKEPSKEVNKEQKMDVQEKTVKSPKRKLLIGSMAALFFLVIAILFAYPKIFKHDELANLRSSDGRISIAVLPFENITNDTTWNYMQAVIQDNLINSLSNNSENLKVRQRESITSLIQGGGSDSYFSITPSVGKGWGLYKQGKYKEALGFLEKSWKIKPVYNHALYLHLEEVKKALASQKNN